MWIKILWNKFLEGKIVILDFLFLLEIFLIYFFRWFLEIFIYLFLSLKEEVVKGVGGKWFF